VYPKGEEGGTVTLKTRQEGDRILVIVEDDGVGFDVEEFREGLRSGKTDSAGLKNISFRLDRILQASLDIESRKGEGTKVTISIPKGENNESDNSR
jgi:signal transduction histidine kinase